MSKQTTLSARESQILELIYTARFVDIGTLRQLVAPTNSRQLVQAVLSRMEARGLIRGHRQPPAATLYGLTAQGSKLLGKEITTQHYRLPKTSRSLEARLGQLLIEHAARERGMVVHRAIPVSPYSRPAALATRQVVIEHYLLSEKLAIEAIETAGGDAAIRRRDLAVGLHPVPEHFKDFFLYYPGQVGVIVIPSGPRTNRRYWQRKAQLLGGILAERIKVLGVFHEPPPAELLAELKSSGLKACTLDKFGAALDRVMPKPGVAVPPPPTTNLQS